MTIELNGNEFSIVARDSFYAYLIYQEVDYWRMFPDDFNVEEFDFTVNRRGFNNKEIEMLKRLCLFAGLNNIWKTE